MAIGAATAKVSGLVNRMVFHMPALISVEEGLRAGKSAVLSATFLLHE